MIERLPLRVATLISNVPYVTKMADGHVVRLEFDLEDLTAEKKKTTKRNICSLPESWTIFDKLREFR